MHIASQTKLTAVLVAIGILITGRVGHAQNLNVHGTLTDWQSAYLATQGGNVGIGLTNPSTKLHVWGNDPGNVVARVENASVTGSARLVVVGNSNTLTGVRSPDRTPPRRFSRRRARYSPRPFDPAARPADCGGGRCRVDVNDLRLR